MQLQYLPDFAFFVRSKTFRTFSRCTRLLPCSFHRRFLLLGFLLFLTSCNSEVSTLDPIPQTPYRGITLRVAFSPNIRHPELFRQHAQEWSIRTGAAVQFVESTAGESDILIVPPAEVPLYAATGRTAEVPGSFRTREYKYQWDNLVDFYSEKLSRWNSAIIGLPLIGKGHVLIYHKEKLNSTAPPATWEQFVDLAKKFHKESGKPSLPALPNRPIDLDTLFYTIAASFDRPGRIQTDQSQVKFDEAEVDQLLSFQYRLKTLKPRINSVAFVQALTVMQKMQPYRPAGPADDPVAAFRDGTALFGLVSLEDLARLPVAPIARRRVSSASLRSREAIISTTSTARKFATWARRSIASLTLAGADGTAS